MRAATAIKQQLFGLLLVLGLSTAQACDGECIQDALAGSLPDYALQALAQIPDPGRKLLAARSYFRSRSSMQERWSWSDKQIAAFEGSPEQTLLLADIARIADHFGAANPGFGLFTNTQVRSLDKQIASWNSNASVGAAAANLLATLESNPSLTIGADAPSPSSRLEAWLTAHTPDPSPNLAAPGLSAHGQMHAIDFQILQNGNLVAQANSADIDGVWRAHGWDVKLKASIAAAGPAFEGPLTSPDEPWHFSYSPHHEETGHVQISP